jgi:hypothetical protein
MCRPALKKPPQPPPAPGISKAKDLRSTQQPQRPIISSDLAAVREWVEAYGEVLPTSCTLLELVLSVNNYTTSDVETVAVVTYLINSGRVRLCGTFAGHGVDHARSGVRTVLHCGRGRAAGGRAAFPRAEA